MNERYQPGGDIFQKIADQYGLEAANRVSVAAASGKQGAIADALAAVKHGPARNESTAAEFWNQLATDPFAAPLKSANNQLSKLSFNLLKNPLVSLVIFGALAIYFWPVLRPIVNRFAK